MVIPFLSRLENGQSVLVPVSRNDIFRSSGEFYVNFRYDSVHDQFTFTDTEYSRIADVWDLDLNTDYARIRGRITELIALRQIFEILWPYRGYFDIIPYNHSKVHNLVMISFSNTNHFLFDIYIPFMDLYIDCKNRWSPESVYPSQVKKLNNGLLPNNAFLRPEDLENISVLHSLFDNFNLGYLTANYTTPNMYDIQGNFKPACSTLLTTSIKMHSFTLSKDILLNITSKNNKIAIPTKKSMRYKEFLELIRTELKKYVDKKIISQKKEMEVIENVTREKVKNVQM